tara:strand:+ start:3356 stop:4060 length:705 start_codon:yes stop_codon:yes gene_type:complete
MMKKKMMSAGGNMKKKGYAAGGMTKKGYAAGGLGMKKKMMSAGGMPMAKDPKTGKMMPKFAMDGVGKMAKGGSAMYKKGYAAGGVAMKKKMMAGGGMSTSDYDITKAKMPGSAKSTRNVSTKKKVPVVTKDRLNKLGMTLREFKNAYEVNAAGTGYKKRSKALKAKGSSTKSRNRSSTMNKANPSLNFGTKKGSGTTVKRSAVEKARDKKAASGLKGFKSLREAFSKRKGFRFD